MPFRHSAQRDDRRRRVLTEEVMAGAAPADNDATEDETPTRRRRKVRRPEPMDGQPRITDLVPKKILTLVLLFLGCLVIVGVLEGLYAWMPKLAEQATDGRIEAFDLDSEGSLAVWFSSATLSAAGLVALLIFSVRRQRADDYRGRYRIWLAAAAAWFLMSIDETASLHEAFKEMMSHGTGHRLLGDGSLWWVLAYLLLLGTVGVRLVLEMRPNRYSIAWLVTAAVCYAVAVIAQLGWVMPESGARGVMLEEGCEMAGNLLLLLAMAVHARYVILEAEGKLPDPEKKRKKGPRTSTDPETDETPSKGPEKKAAEPTVKRTPPLAPLVKESAQKPAPAVKPQPAPAVKPPLAKPATPVAMSTARADVRVDAPQTPAPKHKLSKAERRALRRQQNGRDDEE